MVSKSANIAFSLIVGAVLELLIKGWLWINDQPLIMNPIGGT
jgi:hypothetical protein